MSTTITISSNSPIVIRHDGPPNGHTNGYVNGDSHNRFIEYANSVTTNGHNTHFTAEPGLNDAPDRVKFAYWVPNVSGGLVISKIPQRTSWDYESHVRYAQTAEEVGFEYALTQIRFMAGYGADNQHESVSFSQALLHNTKKLNVIAALLPGP
ncbi:hypothetical protein BPOR_1065g00020 [Botrytis porri]|uniref:Uncharacterized protein n=1 Tax=Botrytis porri TaxID=87229 RepID=A0A4Z1K878_9HELO|nr:hypothetical protein BPOR_1065g00020 [Botrytis porri]